MGLLWAGLGRRPDVVAQLGQWAIALGIPSGEVARHTRVEERARLIHAVIGTRRMLLVIDDAWCAEAALAFRLGGLRCAHVLTTRLASIALDFAGTEMVTVPELEPAGGLLLLERLAPQAVSAEVEGAMELVQAVGGLLLAILLIGQHLHRQSYRHQSQRLHTALAELRTAEARL